MKDGCLIHTDDSFALIEVAFGVISSRRTALHPCLRRDIWFLSSNSPTKAQLADSLMQKIPADDVSSNI